MLLRYLGNYLSKVKYLGEDFLITKNDGVIAELRPATLPPAGTWGIWQRLPPPKFGTLINPHHRHVVEQRDSLEER